MMSFILMVSTLVAMASTNGCHMDEDSLPLSEICKNSFNTNGTECAPYELRQSEGCFKTRFYPQAYWVTTKVQWKSQKKLLGSLKSLYYYLAGENDMGAKLNVTLPVAVKFMSKKNGMPKNVHLSLYVPSDYQDNPPEPNSPKVVLYKYQPRLVYVKPINVSLDEDSTLESYMDSYKELYEELRMAHVYDVDWNYKLIFGYCSLEMKSCKLEIGFMAKTPVPPAPINKVCHSNIMPSAYQCFRGEEVAVVDGTYGLVEERKYPEVSAIHSYVSDGNFKKAFKMIEKYSVGANEESTDVPLQKPYHTFHEMREGKKYAGVAVIPRDGYATPKPNSKKVMVSKYQKTKLYVLAFGGKIKNYDETYKAYHQKLRMMLDKQQISYMKDLEINFDYSDPKDKYQRHEVAVVAEGYDYGSDAYGI